MIAGKKVLLGMTLEEIANETSHLDLPGFAAREIALWIYRRGAMSFEEMTNISKRGRKSLSENFFIGLTPFSKVSVSTDGTKKYLFPAGYNKYIETAYIPEKKRHTLCVSSQVGCKLGCSFCMTAKQGFQGNLSTNEMLNQIISIPEKEKITNLVFMGMGEPFDNTSSVLRALTLLTADYGLALSPRRITVSTVGIIPGMKRYIGESKCQLAVSMHSPFDSERAELIPVEKIYPIKEIIEVLKSYTLDKQRRISFEYILFKGVNDTQKHINQIVRLINGLKCRVNLMRFHAIPGSSLEGTDDEAVQKFRDKLNSKGITATIRVSRGEDIMAACGLLSTKELLENK
ncbi:putative dual-specificity RNA methyltransferase RlmN [subsurface metagenome]